MDFPAPEPVRDTLQTAINHGVFGYELPGRALTQAVAGRMQSLYGWEVTPEMVVATPGIVAGFNAAARAICKEGEGVLVQPPVYHPFHKVPEHTGTLGQVAPLRQRNHQRHTFRYEIDWATFDAAIHSNGRLTGMFLLCHPHNPTGQIYTQAELERMAGICLDKGVVICSDEIHSELVLGGTRHVPLASLSPEIAARSITLVSPSKTFNLVGLFCGFAIIPNQKLRSSFRQVLERRVLHVNSLGLIAAQAAFSGACETWLHELRAYLTANRDMLVSYVRDELPGVRVSVPDATYLAWLDFSELMASGRVKPDPYHFLLQRAQLALNPGAEFGPGGENFVRLNFGCPRATLAEALHRMRSALQSG
jgi:cystathionine beta-lyase